MDSGRDKKSLELRGGRGISLLGKGVEERGRARRMSSKYIFAVHGARIGPIFTCGEARRPMNHKYKSEGGEDAEE